MGKIPGLCEDRWQEALWHVQEVTVPRVWGGERGEKGGEGDKHGAGPKVSCCDGEFYVSTWLGYCSQLFNQTRI